MRILFRLEVIDICHEKLLQHGDIEILLQHGIDLIVLLTPRNLCSDEQIKLFITEMYDSVFKYKTTTSLLFLKTSCEFLLNNFEEEIDEVKVCNFVAPELPIKNFHPGLLVKVLLSIYVACVL